MPLAHSGQIESLDEQGASTGLSGRTAKAALWSVSGQAFAEPIRLAGTVVLARLLTPTDFGLIGMASVFFGLTAITTELGPSAAIMGKRHLSDEETSSLFWGCTLVGFVLTALAAACAPLVAELYGEPRVAGVFAALSVTVLLSAEALVHNALLRRRMDFRVPAMANLVSVTANAVVAVGCALAGLGYWSLVVGTLFGVVSSVMIVQRSARFRPLFRLRWAEIRPYLSFSSTVTASETVNYGAMNADNLIVGRMLGAGALGVYALAYNLITYPVRMFSALVAQATLPALSRLSEESERFRSAYMSAVRLSSAVVLPMLFAALASAPSLIVGLYGPKWSGAILPFQVLCFAGMARSLGIFTRSAFKAAKRPGLQLRWDVVLLVGVVAAAIVGTRWGTAGVAAGVAVATSVAALGALYDAGRLLVVSAHRMIEALLPAFLLALGAWLTAEALLALLAPLGLPEAVRGLLGLAGSLGLTWLWGRRVFADVRSLEYLVTVALTRAERSERVTPANAPEA